MNVPHAHLLCMGPEYALKRYAGPTRSLPPKGAVAVHGRLCKAGRLRGRGAMLREFPATPLGTAQREAT
ncbi:hypothetical protein BLA6993_00590 [Burkholderia lata]|nr:hypothetical protein BLA6993_00590 [Burkholderia lata]